MDAPRIFAINGADPRAVALADPRRRLTWLELESRTNAFGRGVEALGVPPGSHVMLACSSRVEFIEALIGSLRAGMVVTPVKTSWTADELGYILDDAGTRLVVGDVPNARAAASARGLPVLDVDQGPTGEGFERWLARHDDAPLPRERAGMRLSYTSGTTGRPKAVVRVNDVARPWCEAFAASAAFRGVLEVPTTGPHLNVSALFHGAPLAFSLALMACGAPLRILGRWTAEGALEALAEGVHSTCLVPTMLRQLLALPDELRRGFSAPALNCVLHGGEPCPQPLKRAMVEWWGPILTEYYGMTEGGLTVATSAEWLARPGTVGTAKLGMALEILDDQGCPLPPRHAGTIHFRSPRGRAFEYRGAPDKTAQAYSAGGAFTVGDVGFLDEEGYLFISGRKADVIVSGGVNIYPAEIEDVLHGLPEVRDACVVSAPDEMRGETVWAYVVLTEGALDDAAAALARIEAAAGEQLAGYKRPRQYFLRDKMPRDGTGKLLRHVLRREAWGDRSAFAV